METDLERTAQNALVGGCPLKTFLSGQLQHFFRHAALARPKSARAPTKNPLV